jgi:DHA1 family bicyclomycin/chloramphenicol resistance-like MFS transporter
LQSPIGAAVLNGVLVIKFGMEKLITTFFNFFFLVSATCLFIIPKSDVRVLLLFSPCNFFSIGSFSKAYARHVGHIAGTAAAVSVVFLQLWRYPSVFTLAALLPNGSATFVGFQYAPPWQCLLVYLK